MISWDHNLAFPLKWKDDQTIDKCKTRADFPPISSLLDDPVYAKKYANSCGRTARASPAALEERIRAAAAMGGPASGESGCDAAIDELFSYAMVSPTRAASRERGQATGSGSHPSLAELRRSHDELRRSQLPSTGSERGPPSN